MIRRHDSEPADVAAEQQSFTRAMDNLGRLGEVEALLAAMDLEGCREMVDAGGGSGIYSAALCQKYPGLTSTIVDSEATLAVARELLTEHIAGGRIRLRAGDITEDNLGDDVDVVLLSDVVYDASETAKVLNNVRRCLQDAGRLIIRGYYADPDGCAAPFASLFALNILASDPNRTITDFDTMKALVRETGFTITTAGPLTERSQIFIARK